MLFDKSLGAYPQNGTALQFSTFRSMLTNGAILLQDNLMSLSNVSYDAVGILWIDAAFSKSTYSPEEGRAVYHFVRSGGALLVTFGSYPEYEAKWPWFKEVLNPFFGYRRSTDLSTPFGLKSCQPTIAQPDHPLANGIADNFTFALPTTFGGGLTILDPARELKPIFSYVNNTSIYDDPIVIAGEYFPRGKIVLVWDGGVLDDSVIQSASNLQFATNLVRHLKADCDNEGCQGKCTTKRTEKCYKDYCYCEVGFTDETCATDLQPCQYEGGCLPVEKQTPCSWVNPVRCPSGACTYSPSACPLRRRCPPYNVTCIDGTCNTPSYCMSLAKCSNITCADGSCVDDIRDCEIIPPCPFGSSYRCLDGSCAVNSSGCPLATSCKTGGQLCMDGVCRPQCPRYDGCRADTNTSFQCSDFSCVKDSTACNTTCRGDNTTRCWDGFCACTVSFDINFVCTSCPRPASYIKPVSVTVFVPKNTTMTIPVVNKDNYGNGEFLLSVYIEAGTFTEDVTLTVKEIAVGNLRDEKLGDLLVPTTLSSLVDLKISPSLPLQLPILLKFVVAPPSQDLGAKIFNASLTFLDESVYMWTPISLSTVEAVVPVQYVSTQGSVNTDPPPVPPSTLGGGTSHFTTFSVILGNGESGDDGGNGGSGGDGDLAIILPAVLVPVGVGVVLVVVLGIVVGGMAMAWWQKGQLASRHGSVNFGAEDNASIL